jgi:hypothetical protein
MLSVLYDMMLAYDTCDIEETPQARFQQVSDMLFGWIVFYEQGRYNVDQQLALHLQS